MWLRFKMMCSTVSAFGNVGTAKNLKDTGPNETISARMHRQGHKRREAIINWIFCDPDHCRNAHMSDVYDARALLSAKRNAQNE